MNQFQKSLESEGKSQDEAEKIKRDMAVQTILNVGSRSFSHFLNALERYDSHFTSFTDQLELIKSYLFGSVLQIFGITSKPFAFTFEETRSPPRSFHFLASQRSIPPDRTRQVTPVPPTRTIRCSRLGLLSSSRRREEENLGRFGLVECGCRRVENFGE